MKLKDIHPHRWFIKFSSTRNSSTEQEKGSTMNNEIIEVSITSAFTSFNSASSILPSTLSTLSVLDNVLRVQKPVIVKSKIAHPSEALNKE